MRREVFLDEIDDDFRPKDAVCGKCHQPVKDHSAFQLFGHLLREVEGKVSPSDDVYYQICTGPMVKLV